MGYDYSQIKNTLPNIILDAESKLLSEGKLWNGINTILKWDLTLK